MSETPDAVDWRKTFRVAAGLAVVTLVVFLRVTECGFTNYDDQQYVTKNAIVQHGISGAAIQQAFTTTPLNLWHPVTILSLMIDHEVFGNDARGYHAVNLAFHVANVVLLFFWMTSITGGMWRSALLAALFALHPLRVESVAWVAERKDVLSLFFALLCFWCYTAYVMRPALWRYLLSLVFLALSLMAKPMFVTAPFFLFLLDWWPLRRFGAAKSVPDKHPRPKSVTWLILEKLPFAALGAACTAVTLYAHLSTGGLGSAGKIHKVNWYLSYPLSLRLSNGIVSYVRYLWKQVDVSNLAVFYPMPESWPLWQVALCAALLLVVTGIVIVGRKNKPWLFVGWLWYLGMLVPALGVLTQVGQYSLADRYSYFPSAGLLVILIWSIPQLWFEQAKIRVTLCVASGAVLAALAIATYVQIGYWYDSVSLFQHAVACTADNPQANINLAWAHLERGNFGEAEIRAREALRLRPGARDASAVQGLALQQMGKDDQAITVYRQALEYHPDDEQILATLGKALSDREQAAVFKQNINSITGRP